MRFGIDVGSELELKLYQAVLLYRNDHGNRVMATVHGVMQTDTNGAPALGAGQLLSTAALRELTKQLGTSSQAEYLPDNVIARTPELIAWWAPASVRPMFFRQWLGAGRCFRQALSSSRSAIRSSQQRAIRARASGKPKTQSPIPNWQQRPTGTSTTTEGYARGPCAFPSRFRSLPFPAWQQAFFQSEFTHPGGAGRLTTRKGGTTALWKSLVGKKRFPSSALIETETVQDYLRKLEAERR